MLRHLLSYQAARNQTLGELAAALGLDRSAMITLAYTPMPATEDEVHALAARFRIHPDRLLAVVTTRRPRR